MLVRWVIAGVWMLLQAQGHAWAVDVETPNVIGLHKNQATTLLKSLGLRAEVTIDQNCSSYLSVVKQQPPPHTVVGANAVVIIWVNVDRGVSIPDMIGLSFEDAAAILARNELNANLVTRKIDQNPAGLCAQRFIDRGLDPAVVSIVPQPGTFVCPGTVINVYRNHNYSTVYKDMSDGELCP